jgi:hypothetical protein
MKSIILLLIVILAMACKKDEIKTIPMASFAVVNAVSGGITAKLGSNATTISNNGFAQFSLNTGSNDLYVWPINDSLHPYVTYSKFMVVDNEMYSLFLTGTSAAPEGVLIKETIPYRTDSTAGIRFINLSPNTNNKPINVTLSTSPTVIEIANLGYKQYTEFKTYMGTYNSTYTFQVRNDTCASPKPPLGTVALPASAVPRFANITLVIRQNGAGGVSIFRVNNDR